jgi:anti-sigma factor RsiW
VFTLIFLSLFLAAWLFLAFVPWLVLSVATRGNAGLANLPLCLFTGVVAALAVPVLGMDGLAGIWTSMVTAIVAPSLLLAVRRLSLNPVSQVRALPGEGEPK